MADHLPETFNSLEGKLLLADPTLMSGPFHKSVILLTDHTKDDGASGFVLNQPTNKKVGDLLGDEKFDPLKNLRVHLGGPVDQEHLTFCAFWREKDKLKFATRISARDAIVRVQQPGTLVRPFAGYSGWSSGQLESELGQNSWITTPPVGALLTCTHTKNLWSDILRELSPIHKVIAESPDDIFLN